MEYSDLWGLSGKGSPRSWRISYHLKVFAWLGNTDATKIAMCFITSSHTHTHTHTHSDLSPLFYSVTKTSEQLSRDKKRNLPVI